MIYVFMIYLFSKLLAEHTLKHEVSQLLPKDSHGNNIHGHDKRINKTD